MSSIGRGSGATSLSPPKRSLRPAARRMPTKRTSLRNQAELSILHRYEHPCPLIHPVVIRGRHVEHALAADDVMLLLERIATSRATCLATGFSDFDCMRNSTLAQQASVAEIATEHDDDVAEGVCIS